MLLPAIRCRGLPATGPVRGLPGVTEEAAEAFETAERYGGHLPVAEALRLSAILNPQGSLASVVALRARRQESTTARKG